MIDIPTLSLVSALSSFALFFVIFAFWRLLPQEFSLRYWMASSILLVVGEVLISLRNVIPDLISIATTNSALILAVGLQYVATRSLLGLRAGRPWHWIAAVTNFAADIYFTYIEPSSTARVIIYSIIAAPFDAGCGQLFWSDKETRTRKFGQIVALVYFFGAITHMMRGVFAIGVILDSSIRNAYWLIFSIPFFYQIIRHPAIIVIIALKVGSALQEKVDATNSKLAEALEFNRTLLLTSPIPMGVYVASGQCILVNEAHAQLVGATCEALLALNFRNIASWQKSGLLDQCLTALAHHLPQQREFNIVTTFGRNIWIEARILPTHLNGEDHLLIQFIDLTERKRLEEELRHIAFHDSLTLLPNRRLLLDRLKHAALVSGRQHSHVAVLFIDLNRFKQLNDTHGHDAGDQLLIEVARRLQRTLRDSDTVARLGGDEFVVLLEGLAGEADQAAEQAGSVAGKINRALSEEFFLSDISYKCSASIGTKLFLGDDVDADQILKDADAAMYKAKNPKAGNGQPGGA